MSSGFISMSFLSCFNNCSNGAWMQHPYHAANCGLIKINVHDAVPTIFILTVILPNLHNSIIGNFYVWTFLRVSFWYGGTFLYSWSCFWRRILVRPCFYLDVLVILELFKRMVCLLQMCLILLFHLCLLYIYLATHSINSSSHKTSGP